MVHYNVITARSSSKIVIKSFVLLSPGFTESVLPKVTHTHTHTLFSIHTHTYTHTGSFELFVAISGVHGVFYTHTRSPPKLTHTHGYPLKLTHTESFKAYTHRYPPKAEGSPTVRTLREGGKFVSRKYQEVSPSGIIREPVFILWTSKFFLLFSQYIQ